MITATHLLLGAGALALVFGGAYLLRVKRLSEELEAVTRVAIYKVSLSGIDLRIAVTLKNPSGGSIRVKHPFVKLLYGERTIATSTVKDTDVTIPKFSEVNLEPVMVNLGFVTLATTVPALLKEYREGGKLSLVVKTITTINGSLPYTKTDTIVI